jgi:hypothetical protein
MRTRIVTAATGTALSIVFATAETYGAATGAIIPQPVRVWMVGFFIAVVVVVTIQAALERILETIQQQQAQRRAEHDYDDIQRRLRDNGDGVTYLYPKEQED